MAIQSIAVVSVPVSDQDRARHFYVDLLGMELITDQAMPGMRWVQVGVKGGGVSLTLVTWFDTMPAGSMQGLVLRSTDLAADYERLRAAGVAFDGPPEKHAWATETVMRDPDGNGLVLQQA